MKFAFSVRERDKNFVHLDGYISGYSDIQTFVQMLQQQYPPETFDLEFYAVEKKYTSKPIAWDSIKDLYEQEVRNL